MRPAPRPRFICRTPSVSDAAPTGLCEEAAAIVAGQTLPVRTVRALQRMSPSHQLETVSIMVRQGNLSGDFAQALLAATPATKRLDYRRRAKSNSDSARQLGRTVSHLAEAQREAEALRAHHHENLVFLTLAAAWARSWVRDEVIADWLTSRHPAYADVLNRTVNQADFAMVPGRPMKLAYEVAAAVVVASKVKKRRKRRISAA